MARNPAAGRRNNYSLASNPAPERTLRFNVRIATPPPGQDCPPGVGSAYVFSLKPGDIVTAIGRSATSTSSRRRRRWFTSAAARAWPRCAPTCRICWKPRRPRARVSFWYGARSRQEIFYEDYFDGLARNIPNFTFHLALSAPLPEDDWTGHTGFIHEVVLERTCATTPTPPASNTICAARP